MTKKTTSRPTRKAANQRKAKAPRRWLGLFVKLSIVAIVLLAGVLIYLDAVVQEKFSGKRWTVPAKVYARPLEVFAGLKLTQKDFLRELEALGYRRSDQVDGPGLYAVSGSTVEVQTRGFQFYEGAESSQHIRVRFAGDRVSGLSRPGGGDLA